ncbi:GAF domain-containing protein [Vitiosangium sp. GDMCC 1.1324]|uniref:GAF domain-containing protein n=1 Tax=Vitiosangium sp. (strain GDMCC 1.1324) TaxID=2138576 RepID=UPI00130E5537|nr:GAF domain-containing protein [Vitiosangium sp. GDMCC 1.1324]
MSLEAFTKVTEASKLLVEKGFSNQAVMSAMEMVGRAIGVDRAVVYENSSATMPGKRLAPLRHAWGVAPMTPLLQTFPLKDQMSGWVEVLSRGQPVWELVRNIQGPLQVNLEAQGVQSVLLSPINVGNINGPWWGFLRLDDCQKERRWSADELTVIRTLSRSLSNALRQDMRRETLAQTRMDLEAMMQRCAATGSR